MHWQTAEDERRESNIRWILMFALFGMVVYLARGFVAERVLGRRDEADATPRPVTARGELAADEQSTIELFERVAPSVVYVETTIRVRRGFFSMEPLEQREGAGSGFIWDQQGHVVTNFHVIQSVYAGRTGCKVFLKDDSQPYEAKLVGIAPDQDLAVLRLVNVPPAKLRPIPLGRSNTLRVGQKAFAIGNPFGLDHTLTTGVVSALNREIRSITNRPIQGMIQTDSAINPGNSGGPLLDSAGLLIGVTTAIRADASNIGFAVPVDMVNQFIPALLQRGVNAKADLGVDLVPEALLRRLGIRLPVGVMARQVAPGSNAAKAGIRGIQVVEDDIILGDVLVRIDNSEVRSTEHYRMILDQRKVGDKVKVRVRRGDAEFDVTVVLQELN